MKILPVTIFWLAECGFDLEKLVQRLRQEQSDSTRQIVTRSPRRPKHRNDEAA